MARYFIWRSDSPANVTQADSLVDGYHKVRAAMAAIHDRRIEWCLVRDPDDDGDWETVVCGRHGDLI